MHIVSFVLRVEQPCVGEFCLLHMAWKQIYFQTGDLLFRGKPFNWLLFYFHNLQPLAFDPQCWNPCLIGNFRFSKLVFVFAIVDMFRVQQFPQIRLVGFQSRLLTLLRIVIQTSGRLGRHLRGHLLWGLNRSGCGPNGTGFQLRGSPGRRDSVLGLLVVVVMVLNQMHVDFLTQIQHPQNYQIPFPQPNTLKHPQRFQYLGSYLKNQIKSKFFDFPITKNIFLSPSLSSIVSQISDKDYLRRSYKIYSIMQYSRISVLEGHNKDQKTDQLYQPLRKTFLLDTTAKKNYLEDVSHVSHVSHFSRIHNSIENHELGECTLIPQEQTLIRIDSLSRLPRDHQYYIINAQERQLPPISQEELDRRLQNCREEVYMYIYKHQKPDTNTDTKVEVKNIQPLPPRKNSGIRVFTPKYNFFSCLDEGVNNLLEGNACTCPANQLIASKREEVYWDNNGVYLSQS